MQKPTLPSDGLYAITPDQVLPLETLLKEVEEALVGGAVMLQYRRKGQTQGTMLSEARALASLCERYGTRLIVNDDVDLALASGAHGVHLGKDDGDYRALASDRHRSLLLGVSCYDSLQSAREATEAGVDYVAFGSMFPSTTKPGAVHCPLATLREARVALPLPIVAIGGITPDNAPAVIAAGAHFVAAISGVFEPGATRRNARRYACQFPSSRKLADV